jgi:hypothetical protein
MKYAVEMASWGIMARFLCQRLNTATSSSADDVHHYVIPQKLLDFIFNKLPVFTLQWEKEMAVLYPVEVPPPKQTALMLPQWQGKQRVKLTEITRTLLLLPC